MAVFYFGRGFKWLQWFELNSFVSDINKTVQKSGESTRYTISEQTCNIIANEASLIRNFREAFDKTDGTLKEGFGIIGRKIDDLGYGIESLGATFSFGMGLLAQQIEVQTHILRDMLEKLDSIHKTLESPTLTQAREFYNMGRERLQRGLLDKALEAFLKAAEKNDTDFFTQYSLGNIYLYGKNEDCNIIDLGKAKVHFMNAARFAKSEIKDLPEAKKYCGEAYFHLSILEYLFANDAYQTGNLDETNRLLGESAKMAKKAFEIYPVLVESYYQHAKATALLKDVEQTIQSLKFAIQTDRNYSIKIDIDKDFDGIRPQILQLFLSLKKEAADRYAKKRDDIFHIIDNLLFLTDDAQNIKLQINTMLDNANKLSEKGAYFDLLDAIDNLVQIERILAQTCPNKLIIIQNRGVVSFSPKEPILAVGRRNSVQILETFQWQSIKEKRFVIAPQGFFKPREIDIVSISFSPDGKLIVCGGLYGQICMVGVPSLDELARSEIEGAGIIFSVSFSRDSKYLALGAEKGVCLLEFPSLKETNSWNGGKSRSVLFSPDGKYLAGIFSDDENSRLMILDANNWQELRTIPRHGYFHSLDFSSDGKYLACCIGDSILILETISWKIALTLKQKEPLKVLFSPDSLYLASQGLDNALRYWSVPSGKEIAALREISESDKVDSISFSHDGRFLVVGGAYRSGVLVWEKQIVEKNYTK